MLVACVDNELQFIDVNLTQPRCIKKFTCKSAVVRFTVSDNNEHIFCLQQSAVPIVVSIRNMNDVKIINHISAISNITDGVFRKKQPKQVMLGTSASLLAIYDVTLKSILKVATSPGPILFLAVNNNDDQLVVACESGEVAIYELENMTQLIVYIIDNDIKSLRFHPTKPELFSVHDAGNVISVFNIETREITARRQFEDAIKQFGYVPDTEFIVILGSGHKCSIFDMTEDKFVFHHHLRHEPLALAFCGQYFAIGMASGGVAIFDFRKYAFEWKEFKVDADRLHCLQFFAGARFQDIADIEVESVPSSLEVTTGSVTRKSTSKAKSKSEKITDDCRQKLLEIGRKYERVDFSLQRVPHGKIIFEEDSEAILGLIKEDLLAMVTESIDEVELAMKRQLEQFQDFVRAEFSKLVHVNEDTWSSIVSKALQVEDTLKSSAGGASNKSPNEVLSSNDHYD